MNCSKPHIAFTLLLMTIILLALNDKASADWITEALFSEDAGIDSIERFLVIPDKDSNYVFGEPILPVGDVNDDNIDDVILMRRLGYIYDTHNAFLYYGGIHADAVFDDEFLSFKLLTGIIGDVNGDGYTDLGFFNYPDYDFEIHYGGPYLSDSADFKLPGIQTRVTEAVDLDNDGFLDLPLSTSLNGGYVKIFQVSGVYDTIPEYIIQDTSRSLANNLATGDFNGDGHSDLAVAAYMNRDSSFVKFYWGGSDFDTIPDFEIWSNSSMFGRIIFSIDDFNGDGYEDLFISGSGNQPHGVYFGGPEFDNEMDIVVNREGLSYFPPTSAAVAGDINNDGYPDIITGYGIDPAFYFEIRIFLGGPDADGEFDIYMENDMVPGGQRDFGKVVAGVGDFDGDGIDDFAVRSRTTGGCCWLGEVNFFAGWDSKATDVEDNVYSPLPNSIELKQNYPNPFNSGTIIEFNLPRSGFTELKIYNLLGQFIVAPISDYLPAGSHQIKWDGLDHDGRPTATGIYFYQITSSNFTETRKMILLK